MEPKIHQVLSAIRHLSQDLKDAIQKEQVPLSLPKNYMLLEAPRISDQVYFVEQGFAMSFVYINGEKHVEGFFMADQFIFSPRSFYEQVPSHEFIQLMSRSEVLCFSYSAVMRVMQQFSDAHYFYNVIVNTYYDQARQCMRDYKHLTATERYHKLLVQYRGIEQIIPQEYIASYLGITPQSLSRIKRRERP
jgi:CRP-like cAMP-binding protein